MVPDPRSGPLPPTDQVPAPREVWVRTGVVRGHPASEPDASITFADVAASQYRQVIAPIAQVLTGSARSSLAERAGLSRGAVASALEGTAWPQSQTVVRLAYLAGVELFGLAGRDLLTQGPALRPEEQALLFAYRRLTPQERQRMLLQAQQPPDASRLAR